VVGDYQDTGKAVQLADGETASLRTHPQVLRRVLQNLIDRAADCRPVWCLGRGRSPGQYAILHFA
jgi:hypothetical protein